MREWLTVTLLCIVLVHAAAWISDASEAPGNRQETFTQHVERAIIQGSIAKLEALRSSIEGQDGTDRYNLAYLDWRIGQLLPRNENKAKRKLLKRAQEQLELLLEVDPQNAEAHAMHGSVIGEQITGMWSGMRLGRTSKSSLDRALELEPENPRIALQRGISFFFTPKTFGGGLLKAEQELKRARELFAREPAGKPWPNWGRVDVLAWLGKAREEAGESAEALALYEAALKLEPDHSWVRNVLLPGLASAMGVPVGLDKSTGARNASDN